MVQHHDSSVQLSHPIWNHMKNLPVRIAVITFILAALWCFSHIIMTNCVIQHISCISCVNLEQKKKEKCNVNGETNYGFGLCVHFNFEVFDAQFTHPKRSFFNWDSEIWETMFNLWMVFCFSWEKKNVSNPQIRCPLFNTIQFNIISTFSLIQFFFFCGLTRFNQNQSMFYVRLKTTIMSISFFTWCDIYFHLSHPLSFSFFH